MSIIQKVQKKRNKYPKAHEPSSHSTLRAPPPKKKTAKKKKKKQAKRRGEISNQNVQPEVIIKKTYNLSYMFS